MTSIGNGTRKRFEKVFCKDLTVEPIDGQDPILEVDRVNHKLIIRNAEFTGAVTGSGASSADLTTLTTTVTTHVGTAAIHRNYENGLASNDILTTGRVAGDYFTTNATNNNVFITANKPAAVTGADNVVVGKSDTTRALTSGNRNLMLGSSTGKLITTGSDNILLGKDAGDTITTGSSNILIDADVTTGSDSNIVNIGGLYKGVRGSYCEVPVEFRALGGVISTTLTNGAGVVSIPTVSGDMVLHSNTATLSNKSLVAGSTYVIDGSDATKRFAFNLASSTTSSTTTLASLTGENRTYTLPDTSADDTIALLAHAQTLTNKTLAVESTILADAATGTKMVKFSTTGATANKTLTLLSACTDNRTITFPDVTGTVAMTTDLGSLSTVYLGDGAAATPSVAFTSDTNTGVYRVSADILGFAAGGVNILQIAADSLRPQKQITSTVQPCLIRRTSTPVQTVADQTNTIITAWTTDVVNQGGLTYSAGDFTVPSGSINGGIYLVSAQINCTNASGTGYKIVWFVTSTGATQYALTAQDALAAGVKQRFNINAVISLAANESVQLLMWQNSGSGESFPATTDSTNICTMGMLKLF